MTVKHMLEATFWPADWASSRGLTHDRFTMFPLVIFLSYFLLETLFSISVSSCSLKLTCDGDKSIEEEELVLL